MGMMIFLAGPVLKFFPADGSVLAKRENSIVMSIKAQFIDDTLTYVLLLSGPREIVWPYCVAVGLCRHHLSLV